MRTTAPMRRSGSSGSFGLFARADAGGDDAGGFKSVRFVSEDRETRYSNRYSTTTPKLLRWFASYNKGSRTRIRCGPSIIYTLVWEVQYLCSMIRLSREGRHLAGTGRKAVAEPLLIGSRSSRSKGPLSDQVADATKPRGQCRSWVEERTRSREGARVAVRALSTG